MISTLNTFLLSVEVPPSFIPLVGITVIVLLIAGIVLIISHLMLTTANKTFTFFASLLFFSVLLALLKIEHFYAQVAAGVLATSGAIFMFFGRSGN